MLLLFFVFFLCSLFSALSFLWKSAVPDFSSGRILLHVSFNYSMCSVQYSRDIAWCCVHYIWKARWLRCLNINHVLMKRKARHGALSLILSFFVFFNRFLFAFHSATYSLYNRQFSHISANSGRYTLIQWTSEKDMKVRFGASTDKLTQINHTHTAVSIYKVNITKS